MRERLMAHVRQRFSKAPDTQRNRELLDEILQNTLDRFDDLIAQGVPEESAFVQAVDSIGDVESLLEVGPSPKKTRPWGMFAVAGIAVVAIIFLALALVLSAQNRNWYDDSNGEWMEELTNWAEDVGEAAGEWGAQIGEEASGWINGAYSIVYGDEDRYNVGTASVAADGISRVEIYWQAGTVTVEPGAGNSITLTETGTEEEKYQLRYLVEGDLLTIRFAKPGIYRSLPSKDLTVTLPAALEDLVVSTVSASVEVSELPIQAIDLDTVSGCCIVGGDPAVLEWQSVSGALNFTGSASEIQGDSVSGNGTFYLTATPDRFTCDTISGDVTVSIPGERSFQARLDTTSGDFRCDFATVSTGKNEMVYTAAGDAAEFAADTVSGDFSILQS